MYSPCPKCGSTKVNYMRCVDKLRCYACNYRMGGKNRAQIIKSWEQQYKNSEFCKDKA